MKKTTVLASALVGAMAFAGASHAATTVDAPIMTSGVPITATGVQVQAWLNDDFGIQGWTHFSKWGQFEARKGQRVTVTVTTALDGTHPGVSVWWRNTGPMTLNYQQPGVKGSNFYQTHSFNQWDSIKTGILSHDTTGQEMGYLEMVTAANGYDADGVTESLNGALNPQFDGVPGRLVLSFVVPRNGVYQLATGGISPSLSICPTPPKGSTQICTPNATGITYQIDIR